MTVNEAYDRVKSIAQDTNMTLEYKAWLIDKIAYKVQITPDAPPSHHTYVWYMCAVDCSVLEPSETLADAINTLATLTI
jgi:hypothetical protein